MSQASITLIILAIAIVLFVSERVSLAVTAVGVAMALHLTGVITAADAFAGFVNPSVILFVGMFIVGGALFSTGVATKAGRFVVKWAGGNERALLAAVMVLAAAMSATLSNTSTVAVLMPVTIGIAAASGIARGKLLMPLAFAAGLGGMITLAGTPPNAIVRSVLEGSKLGTFGFFEFGLIGVPLTIVGILYMVTVGYKLIPDRTGVVSAPNKAEAKGVSLPQGGSTWQQGVAITVFVGTILAMIFERRLGVPIHVSAVLGALTLVATKVLSDKQASEAVDWGTIFLFSGMLPMATALDRSGAGKLIADGVINIVGQGASPFLITAVLFIVVGGLTQFMSNTAAAAVLAPLALVIANGLGADPRAVLMTVGIAASCAFATPVGTPPNTLVVGPGKFKFLDYTRVGFPLVLVMFVVSVVLIPMIWPFFP